jgi:type III secretory pathway component EscV
LVLILSTVLLGLFALLSGFSIGLFYVPAVLALIVACLATSASRTIEGGGARR